jgi:hypothetical protein
MSRETLPRARTAGENSERARSPISALGLASAYNIDPLLNADCSALQSSSFIQHSVTGELTTTAGPRRRWLVGSFLTRESGGHHSGLG